MTSKSKYLLEIYIISIIGQSSVSPIRHENCYEIYHNGNTKSGVYTLYPWVISEPDYRPIEVYCDMETAGGGWTVRWNVFYYVTKIKIESKLEKSKNIFFYLCWWILLNWILNVLSIVLWWNEKLTDISVSYFTILGIYSFFIWAALKVSQGATKPYAGISLILVGNIFF